jgi:hypothetical protein
MTGAQRSPGQQRLTMEGKALNVRQLVAGHFYTFILKISLYQLFKSVTIPVRNSKIKNACVRILLYRND